MDGAMAGRRTVRWSGRVGRLRRPSGTLALMREGGPERPRPRSAGELDDRLLRGCDPLARGPFQASRNAPLRVPGEVYRLGSVAEALTLHGSHRNAVADSRWMVQPCRPIADPVKETERAARNLRGKGSRTPVRPASELRTWRRIAGRGR